ncbi:MAG: hypothetical protein GY858_05240 [Candidatus Omnitrophica bacterium]|nr:hypothetical protein [Candidatus Omnitrophota bacterium]
MRKERHLHLLLAFFILLIGFGCQGFAADPYSDDGRTITGYYYDPDQGVMLPRYDDLSPTEVEQYLWYVKNTDTATWIRNLKSKQILSLDPGYIPVLSTDQISALKEGKFKKLSQEQRDALGPWQIEVINTKSVKISHLTQAQREHLTSSQIQAITKKGQLRHVPVEKIPSITVAQVASLRNNHFKKFSVEQKAVLTTDQVQAINTVLVNVKTLSDDQLHTLTDDQVTNMKQKFYNRVKDRLTPEQQSLR